MSTSLTQRRVFEEFERSMKLLCHNLKLAIVFDFNLNIHYRNHQKPRQSYDDAIINIVQEKVRQKGAHNFCKKPVASIYPCYKIKKGSRYLVMHMSRVTKFMQCPVFREQR